MVPHLKFLSRFSRSTAVRPKRYFRHPRHSLPRLAGMVEVLETRTLLSGSSITASIGDRVWNDVNGNGLQNFGEPGLPGIKVTLTADGNGNEFETTTNANGLYRFRDVAPGIYSIEVKAPSAWTFTDKNVGGRESRDSDVDESGRIELFQVVAGSLNRDHDAGLHRTSFVELAHVGSRVWQDENGDGRQNGGEPGLGNVIVQLKPHGSSSVIREVVTDSRGNYRFSDVVPSDYDIQVVVPLQLKPTLQDHAGSESRDSDSDENGMIEMISLSAGQKNFDQDIGLVSSSFQASIQRGVHSTGKLISRVWHDENGNGIQDSGEPGEVGVKVHLVPEGSTSAIMSSVSGRNGKTIFQNVAPGSYVLEIERPIAWLFTEAHQGGRVGQDSDVLPDGVIEGVTVNPGETTIDHDIGLTPIDFVRPAQVGDRVWADVNRNGRQDSGEPGVEGLKVRLWEENKVVQVTRTNQRGVYRFRHVDPGTYSIEVQAGARWGFTQAELGGQNSLDSNVDTNGMIGPFEVESGDLQLDWDTGLTSMTSQSPSEIGNRIWNDVNGNGLQDSGEPGIAEISVQLRGASSDTLVATTMTNHSGRYVFRDVAPGRYVVAVVLPAGIQPTVLQAGSDERFDSDAVVSGRTHPIRIVAGDVFRSIDIGLRLESTYLRNLRVSGDGIEVHPSFSPTITRYAVYPTKGIPGRLEIEAFSSVSTDDISIGGQNIQSGDLNRFSQFLPGDTITINVSNGVSQSKQYELIYLPADFPKLAVTKLTEEASPGLTYITTRTPGAVEQYIAMVDNNGVPAYFKTAGTSLGAGFDFKLHANGLRSYIERNGDRNEFGRSNFDVVILDENFHEIDRVHPIGLNNTDNHDFLILPNGNYVFLSYNGEVRPDPDRNGEERVFEDSVIQIMNPTTDSIVMEWNSKNDIPLSDAVGRSLREYAHINSVSVDPIDGHLIGSLRGTSQVVKINADTGELIWKFGGHSSDFVIDDPLGGPAGQHTARRLDNGNLMFFDNGQNLIDSAESQARGLHTRVVEYELDEAAMTARLIWSYAQPGQYARAMGSVQRLENGNTMIGWGLGQHTIATEINSNGEIVFELVGTYDGEFAISYRSWRFPS